MVSSPNPVDCSNDKLLILQQEREKEVERWNNERRICNDE
jgi:hypothetical protein